MDPEILDIILTSLLGAVISIIGWNVKQLFDGTKKMEEQIRNLGNDLSQHKIMDSAAIARLDAQYDNVAQRLASIDEKLQWIAETLMARNNQ